LEDNNTLKITLKHADGVWCEDIVVPELKLLRDDTEDDHLVVVVEQKQNASDLTIYFSCVPKGRVHMPFALREMQEKVKNSKVKLYHGEDLELTVCIFTRRLHWILKEPIYHHLLDTRQRQCGIYP
jgi:hypothetical protein